MTSSFVLFSLLVGLLCLQAAPSNGDALSDFLKPRPGLRDFPLPGRDRPSDDKKPKFPKIPKRPTTKPPSTTKPETTTKSPTRPTKPRPPRPPKGPKPFKFPRCHYFPFYETYGLFESGKQTRLGSVTLDLKAKNLKVTYALDSCRISAANVNIVGKKTSHPNPSRFGCRKQISSSKKKFTIVCPLSSFKNVLCCKDFFVYAHASVQCGRKRRKKKSDAYAGTPSCTGRDKSSDNDSYKGFRGFPGRGRGKGKDKDEQKCNVIAVKPPCPSECECKRKCSCPKPRPSESNSPAPSESNSPAPSESSAPAPSESNSPAPSESNSPGPSESNSPAPSESNSPAPSESNSPAPSESNSPAPSESNSPAPSESNSPAPSESNSPAPSESNSPAPSESNSPAPSESNSPAPSESNSPSPAPSESSSPSPTPCVCPNCFICMGIDANNMPICEPDPNTNDAECNPCENNGNRFCQIAGLPNAFQCCPPTSNCKDTVIPTRLGVPQNSLEVSFVCSRNCGSTCTDIRNSDGESNACALFTPLDLNDDSDPDTDDVLNLCPDVSAD